MNIASEPEIHAAEELSHAITLANQIDYLGGMPKVTPKPVKTSDKAEDMLRFDMENENETIRNYRQRIRQCEGIGEYALAEHLRKMLVQEQDHLIALATALGVDFYSLGIPKNSVLQPETDIKMSKFLVLAHGTESEVEKARQILTRTATRTEAHAVTPEPSFFKS